ncbi:sensor histidine kinase [Rickettsiales endosymbiont of Trichoplax sp. H2]|uniref:sensor histidine kinase n=1 Tax=Rickettsiales endosymbiont of Trichoplax sp. H2 TaxID=2021221 RepID=UPI0012B39123|nr:HAMP domain-containing sensor histidine kinase [Rickettsiales endosymbiont of Trichoplax sp. H2]MSO14411.1 CAI-1 autoinducer sensor kinase/phosphatase CqsS [Rickettsiales endosymbiont of Trichoplax sp. H2]
MAFNFIEKLNNFFSSKTQEEEIDFNVFISFSCVNILIPFFIWDYNKAFVDDAIILRFISGTILAVLLFREYWFIIIRKYFPLVIHFTIFLTLLLIPILHFLFNNNQSWLVNLLINILILSTLITWDIFVIFIIFAQIIFFVMQNIYEIQIKNDLWVSYTYCTVISIIISIIFSRIRLNKYKANLSIAKALSLSIAHELRGSISIINNNVYVLEKIHNLKESNYINELSKSIKFAEEIIEKMLLQFRENIKIDCQYIKCIKIVEEFINECHPNIREYVKLSINIDNNIITYVDKKLFSLILLNIFKNALDAMMDKEDKKIDIYTKLVNKKVILSIKDYGKGIIGSNVQKIFYSFFSEKNDGTGIGLFFCKRLIKKMNGDIYCDSSYGEYTEIMIELPIANNMNK